jgi:hypothetical protein
MKNFSDHLQTFTAAAISLNEESRYFLIWSSTQLPLSSTNVLDQIKNCYERFRFIF